MESFLTLLSWTFKPKTEKNEINNALNGSYHGQAGWIDNIADFVQPETKKSVKQAGAELCQAQVQLS